MTTGAPKPADRWDTDKNVRARLANWMREHGYFEPREADTNAPAENELIVESLYGARRHISICGVRGRQSGSGTWGARKCVARSERLSECGDGCQPRDRPASGVRHLHS